MDTVAWRAHDAARTPTTATDALTMFTDYPSVLAPSSSATSARVPPTPPTSNPNSPEDRNRLVSISTTFFAAAQLDVLPPDLILLSADSVFFNVHSHKLLSATTNGFNGRLPLPPTVDRSDTDPILQMSESADVLNLMLHGIYGLACAHYAPSFEQLSAAIDAFPKYGLHAPSMVGPGSPLFDSLIALAPIRGLDVYILASRTGLHELAVRSSAHLLSLSLASLTDAQAEAMGPLYLKRLFFLHLGRADALKRLLLIPPSDHLPTLTCGRNERAQLTRAWALASAYLAWEGRPDVLPSTIEAAVKPLGDGLTCDHCRTALAERLQTLIAQWSLVKRTI